jgi:hypothetical protein
VRGRSFATAIATGRVSIGLYEASGEARKYPKKPGQTLPDPPGGFLMP